MNYKNELKEIENNLIKEKESLKKNLYGLFTVLILSKRYASKNDELEQIMKLFNFEFKEYVYKSRTILISRVIRIIEKGSDEDNFNRMNILNEFLKDFYKETEEISDDEKKKKKKKNIFDDIFNQLG